MRMCKSALSNESWYTPYRITVMYMRRTDESFKAATLLDAMEDATSRLYAQRREPVEGERGVETVYGPWRPVADQQTDLPVLSEIALKLWGKYTVLAYVTADGVMVLPIEKVELAERLTNKIAKLNGKLEIIKRHLQSVERFSDKPQVDDTAAEID